MARGRLGSEQSGASIDTRGAREGDGLVLRNGVLTTEPVSVTDGRQALTAVKTEDTVKDTDDTAAADPHLVLQLQANTTYVVDGFLLYDAGSNTPDIKFALTGPSGSTIRMTVHGQGASASSTGGNLEQAERAGGVTLNRGALSAEALGSRLVGYVETTVAGDLSLDWAQVTSNANDTTLKKGSWLKATPEGVSGGSSLIAGYSPILDHKPGTDTLDDEFDSTTLDAKWTVVDGTVGTVSLTDTGTTGIIDLTTRPGTLLMQMGSAANDSVILRQDLTLGDGDSVVVSLSIGTDWANAIVGNEFAVGIGLNDTDGSIEGGDDFQFILDADTSIVTIDGVHSSRGSDIGVADADREYGGGERIYFRIVRSTLTYHLYYSWGMGETWAYKGSRTVSTALDNLFLFAEARSTITNSIIVAVDWIRQGGSGLDPWSHSGLIQLDSVPEWITYLDHRVPGETSHEDDIFFNTGTVSTDVDPGSGTAVWTQKYGKLSAGFDSQDANDLAARVWPLTPTSSPVTIETRYSLTAKLDANPMSGLLFADGTAATDDIMAIGFYVNAGDVPIVAFFTGQYNNASVTNIFNDISSGYAQIHKYFRIIWISSNTFAWSVSQDGITWTDFAAADISNTFTPTHFGVWVSNWSQTYTSVSDWDYLRISETDESV